MNEPELQKPGAGLPLIETLLARYLVVPYHSKRSSWDESLARFSKEGERILALLKPLTREQRTRRVLIDRFTGIEDSSRYWSAAMTVEHLIIVGEATAQGIVLLGRGQVPPVEVRIENVKPKGNIDPMQLEAVFSKFMDDYRRKVTTEVADKGSKTTHYHPWLGPMNAAQWNWLMGSHQGIHRKQLQKIVTGLAESGSRLA